MSSEDYRGREQTHLKHRVLDEYLMGWAHKLGAGARKMQGRRTKLWYVDCFSGPWQARAPDGSDTSISIGLSALQKAQRTWASKGLYIDVGAIFVERNLKAFRELQALLLGLDSPPQNVRFVGQRERGLEEASVELLERLRQDGEVQYGALWPPLLRAHHIREQDVADAIADLRRRGRVVVTGLAPGKRRVLDEHGVALMAA